jgi:hypothetical protein
MMNGTRSAWMLIVVLTLFASPRAHAGSNVFKEQLIDYVDKALVQLTKIEGRTRAYSDKERFDFETDNLAVVTLIHRLQETVGETNFREVRNSGRSSRDLLLISQGCIAVEFLRTSIANYVGTGDRAFLVLARDAADLVKSVRKQLDP